MIEGENKGKYPYANCLFIKDNKTGLIDTGAGRVCMELEPEFILNSHWHEDHIGYNDRKSKILAHEFDAQAISSLDEFKARYDLSDVSLFTYGRNIPSKVDEVFSDGDVFEFGSTAITVIHTPGHSAGHCCFLVEDSKTRILFLGDIDLTSFGPWYGCLDCSVSDFINSINKVGEIVDERNINLAISCHREPITGKDAILRSLEEYGKVIFRREKTILELLDTQNRKQVEKLVSRGIFYRKLPEPKEIFEQFERIMLEKHLERIRNIQSK
jgi:glyoxylase-like metal-dependent hydrolase (beta-lactamase superfamily II)